MSKKITKMTSFKLKQTGGRAEQLKMLILGEAGTGKTTLIKAVTETFRYHRKQDLLAKCATTGIAAVEIEALHSH